MSTALNEMQKLNPDDPETRSADIVAGNIERLRELFPEAFKEDGVDFEVLKQLLGGQVNEREEKYGLNWHGKRRARQLALAASSGTLRPEPEESVEWDATQHLILEGDNLEVLRLLQKGYAGKVKLIYIDPPYNTGKDFVYPDDFRDSIRNYQEITGQVGEGGQRISSNTEASGRFHTDWLNMMYPRLKLARSLLRSDGAIFISIDDHEVHNLRVVLDEVFGEENFIGQAIWQKKYSPQNDAKGLSELHEYIVVYARSAEVWRPSLLPRSADAVARYKNPDNDPRGPWKAGDLTSKTKAAGHSYPITGPTGEVFYPTSGRQWAPAQATFNRLLEENRIWFGADGTNVPALKQFLSEVQEGTVPTTLWLRELVGDNQEAARHLADSGIPFDSPKPVRLLKHIVQIGTQSEGCDIVLDFFGGSGTTMEAVLRQNVEDGGTRRVILVQLPEPIDEGDKNQSAAAHFCGSLGLQPNIAEVMKERVRRVGNKIRETHSENLSDLGFRVFKLDSSNIRMWDPNLEDLETSLLDSVEHIKLDRAEQDILYELLLKLGLDLCVPIEKELVAGQTVYIIGGGVLIACMAEHIAHDEVEAIGNAIVECHRTLAPAGDSSCVFRDSAFADDVTKTNLAAILQQHGLQNVRSL